MRRCTIFELSPNKHIMRLQQIKMLTLNSCSAQLSNCVLCSTFLLCLYFDVSRASHKHTIIHKRVTNSNKTYQPQHRTFTNHWQYTTIPEQRHPSKSRKNTKRMEVKTRTKKSDDQNMGIWNFVSTFLVRNEIATSPKRRRTLGQT